MKTYKNKAIIYGIGLVVSYFAMYLIITIAETKALSTVHDWIGGTSLTSFILKWIVISVAFAAVPYELIKRNIGNFGYIWFDDKEIKSRYVTGILCAINLFLCLFMDFSDIGDSFFIRKLSGSIIIFIFLSIFISVYVHKLKSENAKWIIGILINTINSITVFYITNSFVIGLIVFATLILFTIIYNCIRTGKIKWYRLLVTGIFCCLALNFALLVTDHDYNLKLLLNTDAYKIINSEGFLLISKTRYGVLESLLHPFSTINTWIGPWATVLIIIIFIVHVFLLIMAAKEVYKHSATRGGIIMALGMLFTSFVVYTFLADIGLVPALYYYSIFSLNMELLPLALIVRCLIIIKVPEGKSMVEKILDIDCDDDDDDDDMDFEYSLHDRQHLMFQYIVVMENELKKIRLELEKEEHKDDYEEIKKSLEEEKESLRKNNCPSNIQEFLERYEKTYSDRLKKSHTDTSDDEDTE